jgi:signal peptidase I
MRTLILTLSLLLSQSGFAHLSSHEVRIEVVKTGSMLPNIPISSTLTVDESFYATTNPRRFDIVVVHRSFRSSDENTMHVVARIIGLPGESIAMRRGRTYINGRRIKEPFAINPCPTKADESFQCGEMSTMRIPAGEYFLLADNRPQSEDSRLWSPQTIPRSAVIGKVTKIVVPLTTGQQALAAHAP